MGVYDSFELRDFYRINISPGALRADMDIQLNSELHRKFGFSFLLLLACFTLASIATASEEGRKLAQQVYDRPSGRDSSLRATMTLKGKNQSTRVRELSILGLDQGKGERWSLIRFSFPPDIEDTGLLTLDHPGDENDQWIYLPALDRVRLIASNRKGGRFVGSDFTYEDLRDRETNMDEHSIEGVSTVGGVECTQLASVPVDSNNSIYSKRVSCIHLATLTPLQVDFYIKGGSKPAKRLLARKLKKIQGYWTILQSTMYDLRTGTQTQLETTNIKYDMGIPKGLFSKRGLSDPDSERQYEP